MNVKRYFLASGAAYVVFCVLQHFGPNVYFLVDEYEEAKYLWRPQAEMILPLILLGNALYALMFTYIFVKGYQGLGVSEGLRFGLYTTLFVVAPHALYQYAVQPIPSTLAAKWVALGLGDNMILGALVALLYKSPEKA